MDDGQTTEQLPATVAAAGLPATNDYTQYAGAGFEGTDADDFVIPMIRILQSNSPQVEGGKAPIPGAKPGMIFNTVTQDIFDGQRGVQFIPVARDHNVVEYIPRDAGGGFVGIRGLDDPNYVALRKRHGQFGKLPTDDGHELVEAFYMFGTIVTPNELLQRVVIPFASTQIKKYKSWITTADGITMKGPNGLIRLPLFAHKWRLTTVTETNKKGTFQGWRVMLDGASPEAARLATDDFLFQESVKLYNLIKAGRVRVDHEKDAAAGGASTAVDDEVPF